MDVMNSETDSYPPVGFYTATLSTTPALPWLVLSPPCTRKDHRRKMRALECQYRAWSPEPAKRFPSLVGAIDAVFGGDGAKATQAVIDALCPLMGAGYDETRIRMLRGLRGSVIHGGAPNVYESSSYRRYYEAYHVDAVRDLEVIVAKCLQAEIFGAGFPERPYTYAPPRPGTWDSAGCGNCCRRSANACSPRRPRHDRPARRCGNARPPT